MQLIALSGKKANGLFAMVDDEVFDYLSQWKWNIIPKGYAIRTDRSSGRKRTVYMHREIANVLGIEKLGLQIDHIDGNKLNNTRSNLRPATNQLNQANVGLQKNNTTGFKGVTKRTKGRASWYIARIGKDRKRHALGCFKDPAEAHAAYVSAANQMFGEFARG